MIKNLLPYCCKNITKGSLKRPLRNILPTFVVLYWQKKNKEKQYSVEYLKNNRVSDLTENESWAILSIIIFLEKMQTRVEYLEIGIFAGGTIKFLKENSNISSFTGIDLFEDFIPSDDNTHIWRNYTLDQVMTGLGENRVNLLKGNSAIILGELQKQKKEYDFIFIDGNHTYKATKADFLLSNLILKKGGYVAFHNCSTGISQEDKYYLKLDGGPWRLTHELQLGSEFQLIASIERVKIFRRN